MLKAASVPTLLVTLTGWATMNGALVTILVSTNQLEPLKNPPVTKPRTRRMVPTDTDTLVHCQPPAGSAGGPLTRLPAPRLSQSVPLVEASSVARQTSGLVPPRSQVRVEPSKVRLWVAGSVLFSRPR